MSLTLILGTVFQTRLLNLKSLFNQNHRFHLLLPNLL
jgi:hypothetical protein